MVSLGSEASSAAWAASAPAPCSWQPPGHGQKEAQLGASLGWVPQKCQCPLSLASRKASSHSSLGALRPLDWVGTLEDVAVTWQPPLKAEVAPGGPGGAGRGLQQVQTRPTLGPGLGLRLPVAWAGAGSVSSAASFQPWRASRQLVLHLSPVSWLWQGLLSAKHSCCVRGRESQRRARTWPWRQAGLGSKAGAAAGHTGRGLMSPQLPLACLCWAPSLLDCPPRTREKGQGRRSARPPLPTFLHGHGLWSPGSGARL